MSIIRCTARLLKEIRVEPAIGLARSSGLWDWHANLLWLRRKKYVLFTNDQTLYSFLVPWSKQPGSPGFSEVFRLGLFKSLVSEELPEAQVQYILSEHAQMTISKSNNRSVLGSMNDLAFQIKVIAYSDDGMAEIRSPEINRELNRIPMSAIEYHFAIEELKQRLADFHG